jgi:superfamily I DNA/RNA helicase
LTQPATRDTNNQRLIALSRGGSFNRNGWQFHRNLHFKYVILDEAQDTAKSVFEVLRLLITQKHGFCAIGDIEQCLFGFAGCSPENLIAYANERGCHILTLHETFRFGPTIASLANRVVDDMDIEKRFKISTTTSQDSAPIASYPVEDPKLPQQQVLDIVNSWRNRGIPLIQHGRPVPNQ